jgi:microcystin-dependent protein
MKKTMGIGVLSALAVFALVSILTPARAAGDALPVGTVLAWAGETQSIPSGWMLCNGKALSKNVYKELFAAIGTSWGGGAAKFNLPDLRGRFLRGEDGGSGRDPDAKKRSPSQPGGSATGVGSVQDDSLQNHAHDQAPHYHLYTHAGTAAFITDLGSGTGVYKSESFQAGSGEAKAKIYGATTFGTKSRVRPGEETRPKNASVNFIIKVK